MTAEIAVLNRSAVALAADSAVTIGRPPHTKIYNTVNKIFELSAHHPVGVMIYGRLDYLGLPFETLVKVYRKQLGKRGFDHIRGYRDDFLRFLQKDVECLDSDQEDCVSAILFDLFTKSNSRISALIYEDIRKRARYLVSKENTIAQAYIRMQTATLKSKSFATGFKKSKLPEKHKANCQAMASNCFKVFTPNQKTKNMIEAYAGQFLSKSVLSDLRTGIVIVGFGEKELYPTLECMEIDGVIDGKLKYIHVREVDISKTGPHAEILGFAQDDMMKSFVDGIDPSIRHYFDRLIKSAMNDSALELLKSILNDDAKAQTALEGLQPALTKISSAINKNADEYIEKTSSKPIRDMITSMPKQELAMLASSLIEITSLKRKVTREQETVGGEVDVAIISKSEGFVWVKRKHYFPQELNARFFARHYKSLKEAPNA